ncbi:MAG: flagellar hook assembly protein FlgD [bacterium]
MLSTGPVGPNATQNVLGGSQDILGKDDFLRILVSQLRNQDPINPIKSEEFAAQLAQFSSVEQLQNINANLENSIQTNLLLNQAINNTMATTLIGKNVKAFGNAVSLADGESVGLHYSLSSPAENVTIQIMDSNGTVVRTVELKGQAQGEQTFEWDGKDAEGNVLADGKYTFAINATDGNGDGVAATTFISGVIDGIKYENGSALLLLGDLEVNLSDVVEISTPEIP